MLMPNEEFLPLSPQALHEFDREMDMIGSGNGTAADFYASGGGGETGHIVSRHWQEAGTVTAHEAIPGHIGELMLPAARIRVRTGVQ